jgi:hypothetical protein
MRRELLMLTLAIALVGCGGDDGGGSRSLESVQEVVDALRQGGVECLNLELTDPTLGAREEGGCEISGDEVELAIYRDQRTIERLLQAFG